MEYDRNDLRDVSGADGEQHIATSGTGCQHHGRLIHIIDGLYPPC
jgi:hypothetical protein